MSKWFLILLSAALLLCSSQAAAESYIAKLTSSAKAPDGADMLCIGENRFAVVPSYERAYALLSEGSAELIEPNEVEIVFDSNVTLPSDELYAQQWNVQMINADSMWGSEAYGNEIRVGVIDTGCYPHTDLIDNIIAGENYVDDSDYLSDNNGHGTHVSGIIAAAANGIGIVGVAPKAKIVPLRFMSGNNQATTESIARAIVDAVDKFDCRVINMSWGMRFPNSLLEAAIDYAHDEGAICIAAAGNDGGSTIYYPAAFDNVIGVGSVNIDKTTSYFSQKNDSVFICAPGNSIYSTSNDGGYKYLSGTSQAAPTVCGLAALSLSVCESLTNDEFKTLLMQTSEDLGSVGYDTTFGYGLVDCSAILNALFERTDCYVSPVNFTGGNARVVIRNNSSTVLKAQSILSADTIGITNLILMPGKSAVVEKPAYGESAVHFLWNSAENMKPLFSKRMLGE